MSVSQDPVLEALKMCCSREGPSSVDLTVEMVLSRTRPLVNQIFKQQDILHDIVVRHWPTLQNRWTRKSKNKRREILTKAWGQPWMSQCHRPDLIALKKKSDSCDPNIDPYLWPHINVDDLSKTVPLLLLLQSRGCNDPDEFAYADFASCYLGIATDNINRVNLNGYFMMFLGRKTPETYGQLYSDDCEDFSDKDKERCGTKTAVGLVMLTIQARIYDFAVKCCKLILHDIERELLTTGPCLPELPEIPANDMQSGPVSLANIFLEAPYRLPAEIDFEKLHIAISDRLEEARDHLFALRENPDYFSKCLYNQSEHHAKLLPDTNGNRYSLLSSTHGDAQWSQIIRCVLYDSTEHVELLSVLKVRLAELNLLKRKYQGLISPENCLPEAYKITLHRLRCFLQQQITAEIKNIQKSFPASPPLRHIFVREPDDNPMNQATGIQRRDGAILIMAEEKIQFALEALDDEYTRDVLGYKTSLDNLEITLQDNPEMEGLISSVTAKYLSNLKVYIECLHQTNLFQPWVEFLEDDPLNDIDAMKSQYEEDVQFAIRDFAVDLPLSFVPLAKPTENRFFYPAKKRASRDRTCAMRQAERNLDDFWERFLPFMRERKAYSPNVEAALAKGRLVRTPEWTEPDRGEEEHTAHADDTLGRAFGGLHIEEKPTRFVKATEERVKTKTKGKPHICPETAIETPADKNMEEDGEPPKIKVDKRSAKVFNTIFFVPLAGSRPGEIDWSEFLYAMAAVGFSIDKLEGSSWKFTPTNLDVERPICFHEPHSGSKKIPYKNARGIGVRLCKVYGWQHDSFELAT